MSAPNKKNNKNTWIIGSGLLIGTGVGFFFLQESALFFVGSMIIGLGLGLLVASRV